MGIDCCASCREKEDWRKTVGMKPLSKKVTGFRYVDDINKHYTLQRQIRPGYEVYASANELWAIKVINKSLLTNNESEK